MTITDIHVHPTPAVPRETACDALVAAAEHAGIGRLVLLGLVGEMGEQPSPAGVREANDCTIAWTRRRPDVCLGFCYLSPEHDPGFCRDELDRCLAAGLCGLKLWVAVRADDRRLEPLMALAAEHRLPVLHHAWYKTVQACAHESSPREIAELARRHPTVDVIMAHLTGCGQRGVADVRDLPNVYLDTSGSQPVAGLVEYAAREVGAERLLFGSDAPGRDFAVALARIRGSALTVHQQQHVLADNTARLLRLREVGR